MLAYLLDLLFPPREDERVLRTLSRESFCTHATPFAVSTMRPLAVGLALYRDPVVRAAIHEAKYHGSTHAFNLLAALLADFLPEQVADAFDTPGHIYIIPVPLGTERRRERGYNQAEEVARRALALMHDERFALETTLLTRIRETQTQVSLPREARERNMRGAFKATSAPLARSLYLILDDVLTTGATLGACVEALVAAGVSREQLLPIALAYQP